MEKKKVLLGAGALALGYYAYSKGMVPGFPGTLHKGLKKSASLPSVSVLGLSIANGSGVLQLAVTSPGIKATINSVVADIEDNGTRIGTVNFQTPVAIPPGTSTLRYNITLDMTGVASDVIQSGISVASQALQAYANSQAQNQDDTGADTTDTSTAVQGIQKADLAQVVQELMQNTGVHHVLNNVIHFGKTNRPMVEPAVARQMGIAVPDSDKLVALNPAQIKKALNYLITIDSDLFVDGKPTGLLTGIGITDTHTFTVSGTIRINNIGIPFQQEIGAATL